MALVGVMASTMLAPLTSAIAQQAADQVRVKIFLKDADMVTATKVLTQKVGMNFVIDGQGEAFGKVTLNLDDVSPEDAIRYICNAAGAYFRRDDNGVYIISHSKPADPVAPITSAPASKVPTFLRRLKLMKTDSRDMYDMLKFGQPFNTNRGFEDLQRFTNMNESDLNRMFGKNGVSVVNSASFNNQTPTYSPINPRLPAGNVNQDNGSQVALPGDTQDYGAMAAGAGRGGQLGGGGGQVGPGGGGAGAGQGGQGTQLTPGTGLVPQGIDFISYDPTTNEIVVRGTEDAIAELQRYISTFDVAPRQVQIKVEFVTTTDDLDRSLGYDFLYQRGSVFAGNLPGSFARSGDPIFLNYATGNITSRLRAALTEGRGKVVNAPIVRTLNNQPAVLTSSITTFIFINNAFISNGTIVNTAQPFPITAATQLAVAPRINDDGTITVYLNPQIQQFVGTSRGPNGEELPNIVLQSLQVVARVPDGQTIVLGGLTNKNDTTTTSRIPLLSDLPVIGQFFRGTTRTKRNSDLLIFVTPTVVPDEETGGGGG